MADPKKTKAEVHYRLATLPRRTCHDCQHIERHDPDPATCELMLGTVDRKHVCDLFEARRPIH